MSGPQTKELLPEGWTAHYDPELRLTYYHNKNTEESIWEPPPGTRKVPADSGPDDHSRGGERGGERGGDRGGERGGGGGGGGGGSGQPARGERGGVLQPAWSGVRGQGWG